MPVNDNISPSATPASVSNRPLLEPFTSKEARISLLQKAGAEFVGTFILVFSAAGGPIVNQKFDGAESLLGNAACSGLAAIIAILSLGHISGAHINPAVTLAFAAFKHFPWIQVPVYIFAQVCGGISAGFLLKLAYHPFMSGGGTVPSPTASFGQAFLLEIVATFFLMFVITAVATDTRAVGELAGIAIGTTILLDILLIGPSTGGSMNPARTLGPALAAGRYHGIWIYMLAPPIGAILGAGIYSVLKLKDDTTEGSPQRAKSFSR
ncbi:probable aquaporin NIP5-1 [Beta vulgaris subsp. vulgaris]|uniref:probable aquaporin NIP5-1 n=1 Tax=Beta vulgaris subsp. vulgaris TaxID=3555 RepID=UPI002036CBF8|nr:probable aquaporin NIP5-1 [Beta vulgaris subsp. vulgaris]